MTSQHTEGISFLPSIYKDFVSLLRQRHPIVMSTGQILNAVLDKRSEDRVPGRGNQSDNYQVIQVNHKPLASLDRETEVPALRSYCLQRWLSENERDGPWTPLSSIEKSERTVLSPFTKDIIPLDPSLAVGNASRNDYTCDESLEGHNADHCQTTDGLHQRFSDHAYTQHVSLISQAMEAREIKKRDSGVVTDASSDASLPISSNLPRDARQAASSLLLFRDLEFGQIPLKDGLHHHAATLNTSTNDFKPATTATANLEAVTQDPVQKATLECSQKTIGGPGSSKSPLGSRPSRSSCLSNNWTSIKNEARAITLDKEIITSKFGARVLSVQYIIHKLSDTLYSKCKTKFKVCTSSHSAAHGGVPFFRTDQNGTSNLTRKRGKLDRDGGPPRDDDGGGKGKDCSIHVVKSKRSLFFACPFHKFNRHKYCVNLQTGQKYRTCWRPGFESIARLK